MSAWVPPSHMLVRDGMMPWMKEVERVTEGRVKVKLLPKPVTNPINHFDAVRDGLADVAFVSHAYTPARFQLVRVGVLPFSGDNAEVNSVALWRIYSKHFLKQDEHKGVKLLTIYTHGPGIFWNAKRPIRTDRRLRRTQDPRRRRHRGGRRQRAGGQHHLQARARVLRAALHRRRRRRDVPRREHRVVQARQAAQVRDAVSRRALFRQPRVIMNVDRWNKISKADQAAIEKISNEAFSRVVGKAWDDNAGAGFDAFKAGGGEVVPADDALVKSVADKTAQFEQEWVKIVDSKGLDGKAIVAEYRAEVKKVAAGQ